MRKTIQFFLRRTQEEKWDVIAMVKEVKDDDSEVPLPGVTVNIIRMAEVIASEVTNDYGVCELLGVPSGLYEASAEKVGFDTETQPLELELPKSP